MKLFKLFAVIAGGVLLTGCGTTQLATQLISPVTNYKLESAAPPAPIKEVQHFSTPAASRTVSINWKTVPNEQLQSICKTLTKKNLTNGRVFLGCAITTAPGACMIYTSTETSHQILGHEVRHCYDGKFHN